jgi:hypothetical protein
MDTRGHDPPAPAPQTPGDLLDQIRSHPEWTDRQRDEALGRLVERFPADAVMPAVLARLDDLGGPDAEALVRLVEAHPEPSALHALAEALAAQPDLPAERAWEVLSVLDGAGVLADHPVLAERWDELNEALDEDGSLAQLVDQIEGDPDGVWLALQGLGAVESDVRAEIVAGLADVPPGPGLVEFLRLLAYAHDRPTRDAALADLSADDTHQNHTAWAHLAAHHPDPAVAARASDRTGRAAEATARQLAVAAPRFDRALVTAVDGRGRGTVVLSASRAGRRVTAAFGCDVEAGIPEVFGDVAPASADPDDAVAAYVSRLDEDVVENRPDLAVALLAGCLTLCGSDTPPALRFWVEATAGPELRPRPFPAAFPDWEPGQIPFGEMRGRSQAVLDRCPDWLDDSPLTYELAEEILLRQREGDPDPVRDAGAYRFLFEHRLQGQLERYRRMLLWMAWFWRARGDEDDARSALALAWQLSDAQHVVPGHPFTVALTTRSLAAAQDALRAGRDPRRANEHGRPGAI